MVKILNSLFLLTALFSCSFVLSCPGDSLPIKITSTPYEGNESAYFLEGDTFIKVNGTGIPFYDDGSAQVCKQQKKACSDTPISVIGCIPKRLLHPDKLNS